MRINCINLKGELFFLAAVRFGSEFDDGVKGDFNVGQLLMRVVQKVGV
jgi:hypothetical protein